MSGLWCPNGDVLHLSVHSIDIGFFGVVNPFLGSLFDFVLYFPFGSLGFTARGDLLNVSRDTIHERCFTSVIGWALGSVMARWLHLKQVTNVEFLVSPRLFCRGGCERLLGSRVVEV